MQMRWPLTLNFHFLKRLHPGIQHLTWDQHRTHYVDFSCLWCNVLLKIHTCQAVLKFEFRPAAENLKVKWTHTYNFTIFSLSKKKEKERKKTASSYTNRPNLNFEPNYDQNSEPVFREFIVKILKKGSVLVPNFVYILSLVFQRADFATRVCSTSSGVTRGGRGGQVAHPWKVLGEILEGRGKWWKRKKRVEGKRGGKRRERHFWNH